MGTIMSQPTDYSLQYDFTSFQKDNPTVPLPADKIEIEYNNVSQSIGEIITNLGKIQRDDGKVTNGTVTFDSLDASTQALLNENIIPKGEWLISTDYDALNLVQVGDLSYICVVGHNSTSDFATDFSEGKWVLWANGNLTDLTELIVAVAENTGLNRDAIITDLSNRPYAHLPGNLTYLDAGSFSVDVDVSDILVDGDVLRVVVASETIYVYVDSVVFIDGESIILVSKIDNDLNDTMSSVGYSSGSVLDSVFELVTSSISKNDYVMFTDDSDGDKAKKTQVDELAKFMNDGTQFEVGVPVGADIMVFNDVSDSDDPKQVTVQQIVDLTIASVSSDPFVSKAVGEIFGLQTDMVGVVEPSNLGSAKFIKLTAGLTGEGEYNEGLLTNETITSSGAELQVTADIVGGVSDGETIHLINSEESFIKPSVTSGVFEQDAIQNIVGGFEGIHNLHSFSGAFSRPSTSFGISSGVGAGGGNIVFDASNVVRTADRNRPKSVSTVYYMRIQ